MPAKSRCASAANICIETLESRRLMSAVPLVAGDVFMGTSMSSNPNHGPHSTITLTFATESKTGQLTGTLVVANPTDNNGPLTFAFKGSVNKHGAFTLNGTGPNEQGAKLTGAFSANTMTVAGKYVASGPKHHKDSGTLVASRG